MCALAHFLDLRQLADLIDVGEADVDRLHALPAICGELAETDHRIGLTVAGLALTGDTRSPGSPDGKLVPVHTDDGRLGLGLLCRLLSLPFLLHASIDCSPSVAVP